MKTLVKSLRLIRKNNKLSAEVIAFMHIKLGIPEFSRNQDFQALIDPVQLTHKQIIVTTEDTERHRRNQKKFSHKGTGSTEKEENCTI